ncbi:MAG: phosphoribosylglycinamide formyltransferase [Dehalococcoidia bacterium]|nr:MAG: phosphoribosylglycinamide formyltransferase [Dehalococcoidia bacterium]
MNIAVFCSGKGSNLQAIIDAKKSGIFQADIALMVCDNPDAYAVKIAEKKNIPCLVINRKDFSSKEYFEKRIISALEEKQIRLICLAGYMRLFSPEFVQKYAGRIINIHPALLPAFKGASAIEDAFDYGVRVSGVTVHFVTEDVDAGPIILQESVKIEDNDTREVFAEKIHRVEHKLYPQAIKLFIDGRLSIAGRKVEITQSRG